MDAGIGAMWHEIRTKVTITAEKMGGTGRKEKGGNDMAYLCPACNKPMFLDNDGESYACPGSCGRRVYLRVVLPTLEELAEEVRPIVAESEQVGSRAILKVERIPCSTCGKEFKRVVTRGKPRTLCTACHNALQAGSMSKVKFERKMRKEKQPLGKRATHWFRYKIFRAAMKKKGITQKIIAETLHVGATTVYHWSSGERVPAKSVIDALCEICGMVKEEVYGPKTNKINHLEEK